VKQVVQTMISLVSYSKSDQLTVPVVSNIGKIIWMNTVKVKNFPCSENFHSIKANDA